MNAIELPVVKEVSSTLKALYKDRLSKIILYGSFARGEETKDSDIDFLVVLKGEGFDRFKEIKRIGESTYNLKDKFSIYISAKPVEEENYINSSRLFFKIVRREGIEL